MRTTGFAALACIVLVAATPAYGGKGPKVPCLATLDGPELNFPAPPKIPNRVRCIDGDPTCDADGLPNGVCQFDLAVCLNRPEEGCSSPGVAAYTLKNKPPGHTKHNESLQALQDAVHALGLPQGEEACTDPVPVLVPLKGPTGKGFLRKGKLVVKGEATGIDGSKDKDKLKLECVPRPFPLGCQESSSGKLFRALKKHPAAGAAFVDSWTLAGEMGFGPTLGAVVSCDLPDGSFSYTAVLGDVTQLAGISFVFSETGEVGWAPIVIISPPNNMKIFDRAGGVLVEGLGDESPTITLLDVNGDPLPGGNVVPGGLVADGAARGFAPSPTCGDIFDECLTNFARQFAIQLAANSVRDAALAGLCFAASLPGQASGPAIFFICRAAVLALLGHDLPDSFLNLATGELQCLHKLQTGGFLCVDHQDPCAAYGQCSHLGSVPVCVGLGDKCKIIDGLTSVCKEEEGAPGGFICLERSCGDGRLDPANGEECDSGAQGVTGPCVITQIGGKGGKGRCERATCGDGFLCSDPACTSGPDNGPEECDTGSFATLPPQGFECTGECKVEAVCGDNVRVKGEDCDGNDAEKCPRECIAPGEENECTCPPPDLSGDWRICLDEYSTEGQFTRTTCSLCPHPVPPETGCVDHGSQDSGMFQLPWCFNRNTPNIAVMQSGNTLTGEFTLNFNQFPCASNRFDDLLTGSVGSDASVGFTYRTEDTQFGATDVCTNSTLVLTHMVNGRVVSVGRIEGDWSGTFSENFSTADGCGTSSSSGTLGTGKVVVTISPSP